MKAACLSGFHSRHCPSPLEFPFGSIATREIEQNAQRIVLSQLPAGIQPEGLNMLLNMNYSLLHLGIFFQMESAFIWLAGMITAYARDAATVGVFFSTHGHKNRYS